MANFNYFNIVISRAQESKDLVVKGEIENRSSTHYSAVAARIVLFIKNIPIANTVIVINNVPAGSTKVFEKRIEELDYNQVYKDISRTEIYTESAY